MEKKIHYFQAAYSVFFFPIPFLLHILFLPLALDSL